MVFIDTAPVVCVNDSEIYELVLVYLFRMDQRVALVDLDYVYMYII